MLGHVSGLTMDFVVAVAFATMRTVSACTPVGCGTVGTRGVAEVAAESPPAAAEASASILAHLSRFVVSATFQHDKKTVEIQ